MNTMTDPIRNLRQTTNQSEFLRMMKLRPNKISIISEGDSWFDYPRYNIIDRIKNKQIFNLLRLESNGDEASSMMSGKQRHKIMKLLKKYDGLDFFLFSAGGNDIVGEYDMEFLLRPYKSSFSDHEECINITRFKRRLSQIRLAYIELLDLVKQTDHCMLITHSYDKPIPSPKGFEPLGSSFLSKVFGLKSWMWPAMEKLQIPKLWRPKIAEKLFGDFRDMLIGISTQNTNRFVLVDTQGCIKKTEWQSFYY